MAAPAGATTRARAHLALSGEYDAHRRRTQGADSALPLRRAPVATTVGTIASQLGVHHSTVERVLGEAGVERERRRARRPSKLDPYMGFITETLERFPTLTAARLFDMVTARGYSGGPDHFRHRIAQLRPRRPREAYLRLRTLPGEQAQVDWAHFGKLTIGRAERPLMAFVLVLSYSRYAFLRFSLGASLAHLIRGHVEAFSTLGGRRQGPALR